MNSYKVNINGKELSAEVLAKDGPYIKFKVSGNIYEVTLENSLSTLQDDDTDGLLNQSGSLKKTVLAPMPGLIVKIPVKEKQLVKANQLLLTMEAMKMENNIFSPSEGKIKKIHIKTGQEVKNHQLLITIE